MHPPDQELGQQPARQLQRPFDIDKQHGPILIGLVPDLVIVGVVEHHAFAFLPVAALIIHPNPALLGLLRHQKGQMAADQRLGHAAMGQDVITRRQDGEPSVLQAGDSGQNPGGFGTQPAVAFGPVAEAIDDEGLPIVAFGDPLLIGR